MIKEIQPTGNFAYNSTWGYYRNVSGSDFRTQLLVIEVYISICEDENEPL